MFLLKKFAGALTEPLTFALVLALGAWVFWRLRRRRVSVTLLVIAGAIAYLASTTFVASALLKPLANGFTSPLDDPPPVSFVVVLGSWYGPRADLPVTASFNADGLARITEGVRLIRKLPSARLVVSGGSLSGAAVDASALGYARMAQALGVPPESIVVLDRARDTAGEARYLAPVVGAQRFLLVTSAAHMRRSVRLMERAGLQPIAAPATAPPGGPFEWRSLLPGSSGLHGTEAAVHEYLGLAAIALRLD